MPAVKSIVLKPTEKEKLKKIYYDASNPASYGGIEKLSQAVNLPRNKVSKWLNQQWTYGLHKRVRKTFPRRKYVTRGVNEQWQADLMDLQKLSRENSGYKYILIMIDIFSRKAYAHPVKTKSGPEIADAMEVIFSEAKPKYLQTDQGLEFYNRYVKRVLDNLNIELFSVYSENKAALVERLIRTIKEKLYRIFTRQGNYKWLNALPDVIHAYNNSYHRGLKHIPSMVNSENETDIWIKQYSDLKEGNNPKFNIGDRVRISKQKRLFEKGYLQNWTDEEFIISNVNTKYSPILYTLTDLDGEEIKGSFYAHELLKVDNPQQMHRIEKVLRTKIVKGRKLALVKWFGYTKPTWINFNELKPINTV